MKVAVVTGSSDPLSLGFAIARGLARTHKVWLTARTEEKGQRAVSDFQEEFPEAQVDYLKMELTMDSDIEEAARQVGTRLDVLVNNASIRLPSEQTEIFHSAKTANPATDPLDLGSKLAGENQMLRLTPRALLTMMDTNVCASLRLVNAFLPALLISDAPRVVNVSSQRGTFDLQTKQSFETQGVMSYAITKAALNMLTVHQSINLVKLKANAKVNAACPAHAKTRYVQSGNIPLEDGAAVAVWLATLLDDGPTGAFYQARPKAEVEKSGFKRLEW